MQIVINEILTKYDDLGHKDSKNILLILHGWGRSINDWYKVSEELLNDYRIILLDLPGFGGTENPDDSFTIYDYADFVKSFLEKKNIDKCILMGHSFGGRIGLILSSTTNLITKLVLVDAAGIEKKELFVTAKIVFAKTGKRILGKFLPKKIVNKIIDKLGSNDYLNAKELKEIFKTVVSQDLSHHLKDIKIPTLIIWGEKDTVLPISHALYFKNEISTAVLRVVWGADHFPFLEKHTEFMSVLKEEL